MASPESFRRFLVALVVLTIFHGAMSFVTLARAASDLFDSTNIVSIEIRIPDDGMAKLRAYRWTRTNALPKPEVQVTVSDGQRAYTNVALHPKGSWGSFRPIDANPALTLNFDKKARGQTFHGLTKISLNNSVQDHSYIKEKLGRELFQEIGVPVPRSDFVRVSLNERLLGLYVLLEGANKPFVKANFSGSAGTLYDGGYLQDISTPLAITYGDENVGQTPLLQLIHAANLRDPAQRFEALSGLITMEKFIDMMAMEALMVHWDSYAQNRNNYRIYYNPKDQRCTFIPHGLDLIMVPDRIRYLLQPKMVGLIALAVVETPKGDQAYLDRIVSYASRFFTPDKLLARVDAIDNRVRRFRKVDSESDLQFWAKQEKAANELRRLVKVRCQLVDEQLRRPP